MGILSPHNYRYGCDENGYMYAFRFRPGNCTNPNMDKIVIAENQIIMQTFLVQHQFDEETVHIDVIDVINMDIDDYYNRITNDNILRPYRFRSNYASEVYTIYTTDELLTEAIRHVAQDLKFSLYFGECAIRGDVEFIQDILDLIEQLPHATVLDSELFDDGNKLDWTDCVNRFGEYVDDTPSITAKDDFVIGDSLFNFHDPNENVQAITIEAYVQYFTEMLMDDYYA